MVNYSTFSLCKVIIGYSVNVSPWACRFLVSAVIKGSLSRHEFTSNCRINYNTDLSGTSLPAFLFSNRTNNNTADDDDSTPRPRTAATPT